LIQVPCPVCGAEQDRTLFERPGGRTVFAAEMTTDVYADYGRIGRCAVCRMVYRNPREADLDVLGAYAALEDQEYLTERECRGMNALISLRALKRHVPGGRLLEIGCSTGFFLNAARLDFDVSGVEPSSWAASIARERFGLEVHAGPLESFQGPAGSFDAIALIDVIEHLLSPREALQRCASLLRPGGILYVLTPDVESFSARVLGSYWWGLRPAHLTYFSPSTLTRLLDETGFARREVRSFGRIFTYGYWLSRIREYPAPLRSLVGGPIRALGWEDKILYLDTRDSMEMVAVRR
jgi:SAM-dependent methyltransferase